VILKAGDFGLDGTIILMVKLYFQPREYYCQDSQLGLDSPAKYPSSLIILVTIRIFEFIFMMIKVVKQ
jgi:hypothetical protein